MLWYKHDGDEIFEDFFEFQLIDTNDPPNISPVKRVVLKILPRDDLPPMQGQNNKLLVVDFTRIKKLKKKLNLFYISLVFIKLFRNYDSDGVYMLNSDCFYYFLLFLPIY